MGETLDYLLPMDPVELTQDFLRMEKLPLSRQDCWHRVVVSVVSIRKLILAILDVRVRVEVVVVLECQVHLLAT